jgi:hypothetical protein
MNKKNFILVYPNPSRGLYYVEGHDLSESNVIIKDKQGRTTPAVIFKYEKSLIIDLIDQPNGVYILENSISGRSECLIKK